ncbi:hypothetical protein GCM10027612_55120 [Microbispora bryophytorum subsp. camponoti]
MSEPQRVGERAAPSSTTHSPSWAAGPAIVSIPGWCRFDTMSCSATVGCPVTAASSAALATVSTLEVVTPCRAASASAATAAAGESIPCRTKRGSSGSLAGKSNIERGADARPACQCRSA